MPPANLETAHRSCRFLTERGIYRARRRLAEGKTEGLLILPAIPLAPPVGVSKCILVFQGSRKNRMAGFAGRGKAPPRLMPRRRLYKEWRGRKGVALPKTRLGDGRPLPQIPMQAALRRGVIFHSMIPGCGRKINLLLLFFALLPYPGAVECVFHALLTVERLTFPVFLRIIEAWKKIRTALPRSSAKTS